MDWLAETDTLVFGGGGIRGIVFVGALEELVANYPKFLSQIKCVSGTSIGSIMAMLLACQVDLDTIKKLFCSNLWNLLYQEIDLTNLFSQLGLLDSTQLILPNLVPYLHHPDETFAELKRRTGISLLVCVTNLDTRRYEYHSPELTPLLPVARSVLASCAIPVIFAPVLIDQYRYVDGGVLNNVPVNDFFNLRKTLIFRIINSNLVSVKPDQRQGLQYPYPRILDHLTDLLYLALEFIEEEHLKQIPSEFRNHIVTFRFDKNQYSSWSFSLQQKARQEICEIGRQTMETFLKSPNIIVAEILTSFIMNYAARSTTSTTTPTTH